MTKHLEQPWSNTKMLKKTTKVKSTRHPKTHQSNSKTATRHPKSHWEHPKSWQGNQSKLKFTTRDPEMCPKQCQNRWQDTTKSYKKCQKNLQALEVKSLKYIQSNVEINDKVPKAITKLHKKCPKLTGTRSEIHNRNPQAKSTRHLWNAPEATSNSAIRHLNPKNWQGRNVFKVTSKQQQEI